MVAQRGTLTDLAAEISKQTGKNIPYNNLPGLIGRPTTPLAEVVKTALA